jgi:DNA-binding transcriptional ArsR family regulator
VVPLGKAGDPKRPHIRWRECQHKTPELDDLLVWQERFSPTNWGMVCGPVSNVSVVDCDTRQACEWMTSQGLEPAASTPHGLHFYLRSAGTTVRTSSLDMDSVSFEVKSSGSLANFAGEGYRVHDRALHPDGLYSLEELPPGLRAAILLPKSRTKTRQLPAALYEGQRNTTLFRLACSLKGKGMAFEGILAALQSENKARCRPPLSDCELVAMARSSEIKALARVSLPGSAMRVYAVILDETLIRGRLENWLAYSQLEKATGLPQSEVWRALVRLKNMRMIEVHKKGEQRLYRPTRPGEWSF